MFAIAFDLMVAATAAHHPRGVSQAYADIGAVLSGYSFDRVQGSLALPWFPASVRDIRAFKVEHWSDFTQMVKG
jgi:virulence-associated protein VapD